jgi:outer membrane protein TolC
VTAVARLKEIERADQVAVNSARRASDLANAQYRLGAADFLTVLTTERTLYQAEDALLQTHLLRLQAAVGLFRALGGGFDPPKYATRLQSVRASAAANGIAQK